MELDQRVVSLQKSTSKEQEDFIKEFTPFILSTASQRIGRYVEVENDEAYSVALQSFYKAILSFQEEKGHFLPFAKLLIDRDLLNHLKKEKPLEPSVDEIPFSDSQEELLDHLLLKEEIEVFVKDLERFGLQLEDLVELVPKHRDTKEKARQLAFVLAEDEDLMNMIFRKYTLPMTRISLKYQISRKVLYGSREYILSILVVLKNNLTLLYKWI
ncbi:hypothetical protein [Proteiniclasticum ruminis]|jgi:RNA polymerase sigma factor|uniref:RNA polymerase sigma factor SigI n=1 Tax=Proteiniclasticum ruminis TaxID=398199 RepID=A0A1G8SM42_9CLOT|nr:hypothetical protein [Proteiniclasticum ruminis]SDJ30322.1 RNA polymerase sigma factor [Proteiniclasticum ruminis]